MDLRREKEREREREGRFFFFHLIFFLYFTIHSFFQLRFPPVLLLFREPAKKEKKKKKTLLGINRIQTRRRASRVSLFFVYLVDGRRLCRFSSLSPTSFLRLETDLVCPCFSVVAFAGHPLPQPLQLRIAAPTATGARSLRRPSTSVCGRWQEKVSGRCSILGGKRGPHQRRVSSPLRQSSRINLHQIATRLLTTPSPRNP